MKTQLHSPTAMTQMSCALRLLLPRHARLWTSLLALAAFAFGPRPAQAAVTEAWVHRYSNVVVNDSFDWAAKVVRDAADDIIVTGTSGADMLTLKYSGADGSVLWQRRSNGSANSGDAAAADDEASATAAAVAVDGGGNVVVTGTSYNSTDQNGVAYSAFYTTKYGGGDGALVWERRYNDGPALYGAARAVAVDRSGNVVVAGYSSHNRARADAYTVKFAAADGALLWEKRWTNGIAYAVAVDSSGNVVVTGDSEGGYYAAKYAAADGALLWEKRYDGPGHSYSHAKAVAVDGSGNVVVTGTSPGTVDYYYTAKYAAVDGALLWEKRSNNGGHSAVAVDGSGNVVVTAEGGYYTAKYAAADGALLWERRYDGPAKLGDYAHALAVDGSGNVVVTGKSASRATPGSGDVHDIYTAKYASADGALLWEKRYNGPADLDDRGHAVTVDAKGDVIVSGVSATSGSPLVGFVLEGYTAKYASADGALLWEKRGPGAGGVTSAAIDSSGNVVVTRSGYFYSSAGIGNYYMAKYATADGALLWEKRGIRGYASAVVDEKGNVVVTGSSNGGAGGADYYTAKYAAADGTLLWEKRYNGPANLDDIAEAVRVDGNGNVVVTGRSASRRLLSGGFINDYYTAKYAAADGALLWEKRYNGPANRDDYPSGLALGPNGMVVVTGSSSGTGSSPPYAGYDYATVVYRETLPLVAIALVPTGVRLRFTGTLGHSYKIERAPAVTGPWNTINTQTAPAPGLLEYLDATPPAGAAFYRTREP